MSAFVISNDHADYLVTATRHYLDAELDPSSVGRKILAENAKSVAHRYNERPKSVRGYRYTLVPGDLITPVQTIKAVRCWRYQTCEHPGHATSDAWQLMDRLEDEARERLPGYSEAAWLWERP